MSLRVGNLYIKMKDSNVHISGEEKDGFKYSNL